MIAIDLSKQQGLDVDPRAIQQSNFTKNLDRDGNTTILYFAQNRKSFVNAISLNVKRNVTFINIKMKKYNSLNVKLMFKFTP